MIEVSEIVGFKLRGLNFIFLRYFLELRSNTPVHDGFSAVFVNVWRVVGELKLL